MSAKIIINTENLNHTCTECPKVLCRLRDNISKKLHNSQQSFIILSHLKLQKLQVPVKKDTLKQKREVYDILLPQSQFFPPDPHQLTDLRIQRDFFSHSCLLTLRMLGTREKK
jgi:hypothetical protein